MKAQKLRLLVLTLLVLVISPAQKGRAFTTPLHMFQQTLPIASVFSHPLGLTDGVIYQPRVTPDNLGNIIENTDYDVKNPDLKNLNQGNITCFGFDWRDLYHAGEDLYHPDRNIDTVGTDVFAVADGIVKDVSASTWPGSAIVIEHTLPSTQKVYSVYIHVDDVAVLTNDIVYRGQKLGTVEQQPYSGWYPEYHTKSNGDLVADSHLHFEIRYFGDGTNIYTNSGHNYPGCNGAYAARAYTPPDIHPDNFPVPGEGYTDPSNFIATHGVPTATSTSTPIQPPPATATFTPTLTPTSSPALLQWVSVNATSSGTAPSSNTYEASTSAGNDLWFKASGTGSCDAGNPSTGLSVGCSILKSTVRVKNISSHSVTLHWLLTTTSNYPNNIVSKAHYEWNYGGISTKCQFD